MAVLDSHHSGQVARVGKVNRTMTSDLWETRTVPDGLTLELWAGGNPALVLVQGERRV